MEVVDSLRATKQYLQKDIVEAYTHLSAMATSVDVTAELPRPTQLLSDLQDYLDLKSDLRDYVHESTGSQVLSSAIGCLQAASGRSNDGDHGKVDAFVRGPASMLDHHTALEIRRAASGLLEQLKQVQTIQSRIRSDLSLLFADFDDQDDDATRDQSQGGP